MPVSVLEHVHGTEIPDKWLKGKEINPDETFKIFIVPDKDFQGLSNGKVYNNKIKTMLGKAKNMHQQHLKSGMGKEEAFENLKKVQKKIEKHLNEK